MVACNMSIKSGRSLKFLFFKKMFDKMRLVHIPQKERDRKMEVPFSRIDIRKVIHILKAQ